MFEAVQHPFYPLRVFLKGAALEYSARLLALNDHASSILDTDSILIISDSRSGSLGNVC